MFEYKNKLLQRWFRLALTGSLVVAMGLIAGSTVRAQETTPPPEPLAATSAESSSPAQPTAGPVAPSPVYTGYKGVTIGMSADDVRKKLDNLKDKGSSQDLFVFSGGELASVYYDDEGKVRAISVDFLGVKAGAPSAELVLGEAAVAKPDGSEFGVKRYPAAGYQVMFSRTGGKDPITTVTMQKL